MSCKIDDASAAPNGFLIVFKSIDSDMSRDVVSIELRKMTELDKQTPDVPETSTKNLESLRLGHRRKCQREIAHAGTSLTMSEVKSTPGKDLSSGSSHRAGHKAEGLEQAEREQVFDDLFQTSAHPWYFHILSIA